MRKGDAKRLVLSIIIGLALAAFVSIIAFKINAPDELSLSPTNNLMLYVWNGGQIVHTEQTTAVTQGTATFSQTSLPVGSYEWNIKVYDNFGRNSFAPQNFTFTVQEESPGPSPPSPDGGGGGGGGGGKKTNQNNQTQNNQTNQTSPNNITNGTGPEIPENNSEEKQEERKYPVPAIIFGLFAIMIAATVTIVITHHHFEHEVDAPMTASIVFIFAFMLFMSFQSSQQIKLSPILDGGSFIIELVSPPNGATISGQNIIFSGTFTRNMPTWGKVNEGRPIDSETGARDIYEEPLSGDNIFLDNQGNIIYFYRGAELRAQTSGEITDVRAGRLNANKEWEILSTDNQWSSSPYAVPQSMGGPKAVIDSIKVFDHPSQEGNLFGIMASGIKRGPKGLDAHSSAFNFVLDNGEFKFWTRASLEPHHAQPILYHWGSTGGILGHNYDIDVGQNEAILLNGEISNVGQSRNIIMARYKNGIWENWKNNGWVDAYGNPLNTEYSPLPFFQQQSREPIPRISYLQGTDEYIVTYIKAIGNSMIGIRAALFNPQTNQWKVWDGTGWNTNYNLQTDLTVISSNSRFQERERKSRGDSIDEVYIELGNIRSIHYNHTLQQWTISSSPISGANRFRTALDQEGTLWIAVEKSGAIEIYRYANGWEYDSRAAQSNSIAIHSFIFKDNAPILLAIEQYNGKKRLFAFSNIEDPFWDNEVPRQVVGGASTSSGQLTSQYGQEIAQLNMKVNTTIVDQGTTYNYAIYPIFCDRMTLDSEQKLYCTYPEWNQPGVAIYPAGYNIALGSTVPENNAVYWGDNTWGGYFEWMGGIGIDNTKDKVYISNLLHIQSNIMPSSSLQIWDKNRNTQSTARFVSTPDGRVPLSNLYTPEIAFSPSGYFKWPSDSAVDEANSYLYVSESGANRIAKFVEGEDGLNFISNIEGFNFPTGLDTDSSGNLYVVDSANHRIVKLNPDGQIITTFGSAGREEGQFLYPYDVAVDKVKGYVYVTDPYNARLQIFTLNGDFVYAFSTWDSQAPQILTESMGHAGSVAANNNEVYVSLISWVAQGGGTIAKFQMNLP